MATPKYRQYVQEMWEKNEALFESFRPIHDGYKQDRKKFSADFHAKGKAVVDVMREWEQRLCAGMERGKHAQYSVKVAQKFWDEIKEEFSHIELVGVKSNLD